MFLYSLICCDFNLSLMFMVWQTEMNLSFFATFSFFRKKRIALFCSRLLLRVGSVLFSLLYVLTWQHPGPGVHPSLQAGTASSTPSVTPRWFYSGPRVTGARPQIHVLCGLKGSGYSPLEFFMGGFGICQVRTNTAIVVCLMWLLASHLVADVLSGLHCLHFSPERLPGGMKTDGCAWPRRKIKT